VKTTRIPLTHRQVSGISCSRPEVTLRVRTRYGDFIDVRFHVDTAADLTVIPLRIAEAERIPFSRANPGSAIGIVGSVEKFRDTVHLRIGAEEFDWPCDFTHSPPVPSSALGGPSPSSPEPYGVLGRAGFLGEFAICIDSDYLTITRLGPVRKWWRRVRKHLGLHLRAEHPLDQAL
jgi:hypothetical protein